MGKKPKPELEMDPVLPICGPCPHLARMYHCLGAKGQLERKSLIETDSKKPESMQRPGLGKGCWLDGEFGDWGIPI